MAVCLYRDVNLAFSLSIYHESYNILYDEIVEKIPCSLEFIWIIAIYFAGCTYCIHRCEWAHYPVKSGAQGKSFFFSWVCVCEREKHDNIWLIKLIMQFSVTEHFRTSEIGNLQFLPGVFFFYDLSPIKVGFTAFSVPWKKVPCKLIISIFICSYFLVNLDFILCTLWFLKSFSLFLCKISFVNSISSIPVCKL